MLSRYTLKISNKSIVEPSPNDDSRPQNLISLSLRPLHCPNRSESKTPEPPNYNITLTADPKALKPEARTGCPKCCGISGGRAGSSGAS